MRGIPVNLWNSRKEIVKDGERSSVIEETDIRQLFVYI